MDAQNSSLVTDLSYKLVGHIHTQTKRDVECRSSKKCRVEDSDTLGALPMDLQWRILSLTPISDAAKIGFTSTAWRTTWRSLPRLRFDYDQFPGVYSSNAERRRAFVRFVNYALAWHTDSDVHKFQMWLWPSMDYTISIHIRWIKFAIEHNVQKLVLFGRIGRNQKIPDCVFSCQSIVKLELAIESYDLIWPGNCSLPKLRKLNLKFLHNLAFLQDLFPCCPALEKLSIYFCSVEGLGNLNVTAPKLTEFVMCNCPSMGVMGNGSPKFPTACHLSKFIWISFAGETELVPAKSFGLVISDQVMRMRKKCNNSVIKVTRELLKAKDLAIAPDLIWLLSQIHDLPRQLAGDVFCNVKDLSIPLLSEMPSVRTVLLLISRCVFVSKVFLMFWRPETETDELWDLDLDLRSFGSRRAFGNITSIRIANFEGSRGEMVMVRLLLAHAPKLVSMRIAMNALVRRSHTLVEEKVEIIRAYERASSSANVRFLQYESPPESVE